MIRSTTAIVVKELRENLPWAGLILLSTFGLLIMSIYQERRTGIPFLEKTMLTSGLFMYPGAGLLLGFVQIFQDYRKGRWQFVTHRPVSRGHLFIAKVIAGLVMYLSATLLPLILTAIWVATPGHVPGPFTLDMLQPLLALLLSGIVWYAAGLLIAARTANWFASRIMPVGLAIVAMLVGIGLAMTFLQAVLITVGFTAVFLLGACGAFAAGGEASRIPNWAKPSIGLAISIGWVMAVVMAMIGVDETVRTVFPDNQIAVKSVRYKLNAEGDMVEDRAEDRDQVDIESTGISLYHEANLTRVSLVDENGFQHAESYFRPVPGANVRSWSGAGRAENWFYDAHEQTLKGYEYKTAQWIGSMGRDGFVPAGKPVRPFAEPLKLSEWYTSDTAIISGNAVFQFDVERRHMITVYSGPTDERVVAASFLSDSDTRFKTRKVGNFSKAPHASYYAIATRKYIHILRDGKPFTTVPIDPKIADSYYAVVGRTADDHIVVASGLDSSWDDRRSFVYDTTGKLIRHTEMPATTFPYTFREQPLWEKYGQIIPAPPAFFSLILILHSSKDHVAPWPEFAKIGIVAVAYMAVAFCILRRGHIGGVGTYIWLIVVAMLGLSGILVLLSMIDRVAAIPCKKCGQRRLASEAQCRHCQTPAPVPAMEGIEIFKPSLV